ncbi:MAG: hypothetical protein ACFFCW_14935 [Candidatus Hodarchaeota archaeon]
MRSEKIEGDLRVDHQLEFNGMVTGKILVVEGGELDFHGICNGDLILEHKSKVILHGLVNGNEFNRAGELHILGTVNGSVNTDKDKTIIDKNAVIASNKLT